MVTSTLISQAANPIVKVKREIYIANTTPKKAPWIFMYSGKGGYREEIQTVWSHATQVRGYGDSPQEPHRRISHDNGKTWSPLAGASSHDDIHGKGVGA